MVLIRVTGDVNRRKRGGECDIVAKRCQCEQQSPNVRAHFTKKYVLAAKSTFFFFLTDQLYKRVSKNAVSASCEILNLGPKCLCGAIFGLNEALQFNVDFLRSDLDRLYGAFAPSCGISVPRNGLASRSFLDLSKIDATCEPRLGSSGLPLASEQTPSNPSSVSSRNKGRTPYVSLPRHTFCSVVSKRTKAKVPSRSEAALSMPKRSYKWSKTSPSTSVWQSNSNRFLS